MRLCIYSGRQFEETVEKNVRMQPFVTLHLFMQAIWENIWKLPQAKSCSYAINATFHLFRQAIWENIWKLPQVKKCKNAINANLSLFGQTIWGDSWKKRTSANICDFPSLQAGDVRKHLKTPLGEKAYKCIQCNFASVRADNLRRQLKKKPKNATICNFASIQAGDLSKHLKPPSGEKYHRRWR